MLSGRLRLPVGDDWNKNDRWTIGIFIQASRVMDGHFDGLFSVHVPAMANSHNLNDQNPLINLIEHPVITDPNSMSEVTSSQLLAAWEDTDSRQDPRRPK